MTGALALLLPAAATLPSRVPEAAVAVPAAALLVAVSVPLVLLASTTALWLSSRLVGT